MDINRKKFKYRSQAFSWR